jgi:uncharacterized repeat protein (TIGR03803 family)
MKTGLPSGLIQAKDGNFYGTTRYGGTSNTGTVFRVTPSGTLTTLVNFGSTNGNDPVAGLIEASDGNFYGITRGGYYGCSSPPYEDCGTVFKITSTGAFTTLVKFNNANGRRPLATLLQASDENFYGTTEGGESTCASWTGCGTVFRMTPDGTLTTLISFNGKNGFFPSAKLTQAKDGNLYGTTAFGGTADLGTVFKLLLP